MISIPRDVQEMLDIIVPMRERERAKIKQPQMPLFPPSPPDPRDEKGRYE